jgi:hypothetical protein
LFCAGGHCTRERGDHLAFGQDYEEALGPQPPLRWQKKGARPGEFLAGRCHSLVLDLEQLGCL